MEPRIKSTRPSSQKDIRELLHHLKCIVSYLEVIKIQDEDTEVAEVSLSNETTSRSFDTKFSIKKKDLKESFISDYLENARNDIQVYENKLEEIAKIIFE